MSTAVASEPLIREVRVTRSEIVAHLADGRVISVPLAWSWRLSEATAAERANYRLIGAGQGIHWPDVDEDISVDGMLHGSPAPRPSARPPRAAVPARPGGRRLKKAANSPMQRAAGTAGRR